jgi:hypothetical protein
MIVLMRLYPKEKQDVEKIWDYLDQRFSSPATARKVRPLILSMQTRARFISLFLEAEDIEEIGDVLTEDIGICPEVVDTTTIPLLKMVFPPTPKEKPKHLKRFSVMIRVKPKDYKSIFSKVKDLKPGAGVFATFTACILGDYDMLLSMCSTSQKKVKEYVAQNVWKIEGVEDVRIFPIQKSKHLLSGEDWQRFQRAYLYVPPWVTDEVRDTLAFAFFLTEEDIGVSGVMKSES